jgi:signal transduction histidine kinase
MFKAAVVRLTLWYLLLIMLLSVGFSVALYRVSTRELDINQQQLESLLEQRFFPGLRPPADFQQYSQARLQQVVKSRERIRWNLAYFNLVILLAGGAASYFLARRTLQPIEQSVEAQARFTSDASHELRTPLTAIKSEIEVAMRDKNLTLREAKELLASNLEEVDRLEALSAGLLKLAQNDTRPPSLPCKVAEIAEEAEQRVSTAARQRGIVIEREMGAEVVSGDQWSLVELLSILLDNAIKYSPDDSKITVSSSTQHARYIAISVQDKGTGIAATDLPRIFERFYRADRSRTKGTTPGYGLGLSIAKKIADIHRGSIEVKSTLGNGSIFTVLLPTYKDHPL